MSGGDGGRGGARRQQGPERIAQDQGVAREVGRYRQPAPRLPHHEGERTGRRIRQEEVQGAPGAVNEADVSNVVARGFGGRAPCTHICSDLACVRVGASWNYVCLLIDLCNGEIVGHSEGPRRDARAPSQALGLRALVQQLQDPLDAGLHVAGRVQGGGAVPPGIVQISVANP